MCADYTRKQIRSHLQKHCWTGSGRPHLNRCAGIRLMLYQHLLHSILPEVLPQLHHVLPIAAQRPCTCQFQSPLQLHLKDPAEHRPQPFFISMLLRDTWFTYHPQLQLQQGEGRCILQMIGPRKDSRMKLLCAGSDRVISNPVLCRAVQVAVRHWRHSHHHQLTCWMKHIITALIMPPALRVDAQDPVHPALSHLVS